MKRIEKLGFLALLMAFSMVLGTGPAFSEQPGSSNYPKVNIKNSTAYSISGKVLYKSGVCKNDNYGMGPWKEWTASSRGVCLVSKITADVSTPKGTKAAKAYTSSVGTSFSQFVIIQTKDDPLEFEVSRRP